MRLSKYKKNLCTICFFVCLLCCVITLAAVSYRDLARKSLWTLFGNMSESLTYRDASKLKAARMRRRWNARSEIWRSMHYTSAASCPDSTAGVPLFFFWGRGFMLAGELLSLHFVQLRGIENVCTKFRFVALQASGRVSLQGSCVYYAILTNDHLNLL